MQQDFQEILSHKTKVAIIENNSESIVFKLVLHIIHFLGKEIDFSNQQEEKITSKNDFILLGVQENTDEIFNIHPNIVLICKKVLDKDFLKKLIESITPGGIFIYNESGEEIPKILENIQNHIRKISYKTPDFQKNGDKILLNTDIGELPINCDKENIDFIEASRILCQQMGIQEEEYYEALLNFDF